MAVVFGTRPDAIKMAPVAMTLAGDPRFRCITIATAQHREMLDDVLGLFDLVPEYDLEVMAEGQSLTDITTRVLERIGAVFADCRPDIVLVHGDTSTSTAAALAAYYHKITVGHVEAGLRTDTIYEPFPEEMNRRITGVIASLHFAPTAQAKSNLLREGKAPACIVVTGNTVIDAFLWASRQLPPHAAPASGRGRLLFVEAHRRENLGPPLASICRALRAIVRERPDVSLVWPVHPNPDVVTTVREILDGEPRVALVAPLNYRDLIGALSRASIVLTDSGGLQEEAPCLGKPVLVLRRVTERPEGVAAGTLRLVGTDERSITDAVRLLLDDRAAYQQMVCASNPYGDGNASQRIADSLWAHYRGAQPPVEFAACAGQPAAAEAF